MSTPRQFTDEDRAKTAETLELRKDPARLLAESGLDIPARERAAILERLEQMPASWRRLYLRALGGSQAAAIKSHCGECMGWVRDEITKCTAPACPLYHVRPFQDG